MTKKLFEFDNKHFFATTGKLMVPVILQQMITMGVNFLDNIMIGGFGESAIAAASFSNSFYSIFQFICMGLGSGAVVLSSQFWGKKDEKALRNTASMAMQVTLLICALFTAVSVVAPAGILGLYTNQKSVVTVGAPYLRLLGTTFLLAGLSSTATYLLRSTGKVNIPLIGSAVAFFANIFFNWVFIFGKLGAPRLELIGAAVGTMIARLLEFGIVFGYFVLKDKNLGFRLRHFFNFRSNLWGQYFRFAVPVLISDTLLGVSLSITSAITGHVSEEMSAASSIVGSVVQILTVLNIGMSGASAIVIGNSIGEEQLDLAKRQGNTYVVISIVFGLLLIPLLVLLEGPYLSIYAVTDVTRSIAHKMLLCNCMFMPIQTMAYVTSKGILRGGGDTRFLLLADSSMVWFVSIPLGALAALVWHLDPFWIYFFLRIEFPLKGLICFARYCTGRWIKVIGAQKN